MDIIAREKAWLLSEKYQNQASDAYFKECELINQGMPVAYLIGHIPFVDAHIDLSYKPLIPRPETEYWTAAFINEWKDTHAENKIPNLQILDLCAGSGCIGIAIQKRFTYARVDFAEIDPKNRKQILINIEKNLTNYQGVVYKGDLFSKIPTNLYDVIVTNPPYISLDRKETVQESVLKYEDERALFAHDNGLEIIKRIIAEAPRYLSDKGKVYVEFDPWQIELIDDFMNAQESFDWKFQDDQYEKPRVLVCTKR